MCILGLTHAYPPSLRHARVCVYAIQQVSKERVLVEQQRQAKKQQQQQDQQQQREEEERRRKGGGGTKRARQLVKEASVSRAGARHVAYGPFSGKLASLLG